MSASDIDWEPVNFNNKETGIAYDDLLLLMMNSFMHHGMVFNTREIVLCIFNSIFMGCELISISAK